MPEAVVKCQRHRQPKVMECYKENPILQSKFFVGFFLTKPTGGLRVVRIKQ